MTVECRAKFLYQDIKDYLIRQMQLGKLGEGGRIPGERVLAEQLKISRGTVRNALEVLEREHFIERLPSKGAFIRTPGERQKVKLCLIYPEEKIDGRVGYANYNLYNEVWRGILNFVSANNAELSFVYCPENGIGRQRYAADIVKQYDGAFFIGIQLEELRREFDILNFPYTVIGKNPVPLRHNIYYDMPGIFQKLIEYMYSAGIRRPHIFSLGIQPDQIQLDKERVLIDGWGKYGIQLGELDFFRLPEYGSEAELLPEFEKIYLHDKRPLPDAFLTLTPLLGFSVLNFALKHSFRVPEDFAVVGYDHNNNIRGGAIALTHVRLPHYEIGYQAAELLYRKIMFDQEIPDVFLLQAEFVLGDTTFPKPTI